MNDLHSDSGVAHVPADSPNVRSPPPENRVGRGGAEQTVTEEGIGAHPIIPAHLLDIPPVSTLFLQCIVQCTSG